MIHIKIIFNNNDIYAYKNNIPKFHYIPLIPYSHLLLSSPKISSLLLIYNCMFVRTVIIVLRFRNLLLLVFKTFTFEGNALILNIYYYGIYYMYIFNIII
jgi:hypothetical protein